MERQGARARLRRDVAHRHLRSRSATALLAHRQPLPRLQRRRAERRQPLHQLGRRVDPASGTLQWHYQFTPHDLHDWDATETPVLIDATFRGRPRKLLVQGNRNGFFYVLDRLTGELLMAEPFVKHLTWASGIGA